MAKIVAAALLMADLLAFASWSNAETPDGVAYGTKVKFSAGRPLHFPDFNIAYLGKRHVTPRQYPRGWWSYDFKVRGKGDEQTVSWSAGTGDIGPTRFKVDGAEFQLELSHADRLGTLREDEMVVSPVK